MEGSSGAQATGDVVTPQNMPASGAYEDALAPYHISTLLMSALHVGELNRVGGNPAGFWPLRRSSILANFDICLLRSSCSNP